LGKSGSRADVLKCNGNKGKGAIPTNISVEAAGAALEKREVRKKVTGGWGRRRDEHLVVEF